VNKEDTEKLEDPQNWVLKRKIEYEPILKVNDVDIKGEVRLMYLWPDGHDKLILTTNCLRLSSGKMINSQLNKTSEWCSALIVFMQK
jgi:hypothetical protein